MKEKYTVVSKFSIEEFDKVKSNLFLRDIFSIEHIDSHNDSVTFKEVFLLEDIKND